MRSCPSLAKAGIAAAVVLLTLLSAPPSSAQSLWGVNGAAMVAENQAGPPAGPCGYPNGPMINVLPYAVPWVCPTPAAFPPGMGDVTVDRVADTVWVTDGIVVTGYNKAGAPVGMFINPLPGPLTGLGWSALSPVAVVPGPLLWLTDGMFAAAVPVPPVGPCAAVIPFAVPPFPVMFPGLASDIDFDPASGTLFLSNMNGAISNEAVGGGPGPFGVFAPAAPCALAIGLDGLAIDAATCKALYVTDGVAVARVDFAGAPAPPTFYSPVPCWPWAGTGFTHGLAFDATPIQYGVGCDSAGGVPPKFAIVGQAVSPSPAPLAVNLTGAAPGGVAILLLGTGAACPSIPVGGFGCNIHVLPILLTVGPVPLPATGNLTLNLNIPPGLACTGAQAYLQWIVGPPFGGGIQVSNAVHLAVAAP